MASLNLEGAGRRVCRNPQGMPCENDGALRLSRCVRNNHAMNCADVLSRVSAYRDAKPKSPERGQIASQLAESLSLASWSGWLIVVKKGDENL